MEFWQRYIKLKKNQMPKNVFITASIAGNTDIADTLLSLYLQGKKTAGSGLVKDYILSQDPLPAIGNYWIILDSHQIPKCIVQVVKVEIHLFKEIPERIAIAEGEGDLSLAFWKKAHRNFFTPYLPQLQIDNLEEEEIVTEFFEVVFKD